MTPTTRFSLSGSRQYVSNGIRLRLALTKVEDGGAPVARVQAGTVGTPATGSWYRVGDTIEVGPERFAVERIVPRGEGAPSVTLRALT